LTFLGILGTLKFLVFKLSDYLSLFIDKQEEVICEIVAQKSAALAAQNFMISMAAVNYDTCPMEGFDSLRVKKILNTSCR
jgi:nitroreductase